MDLFNVGINSSSSQFSSDMNLNNFSNGTFYPGTYLPYKSVSSTYTPDIEYGLFDKPLNIPIITSSPPRTYSSSSSLLSDQEVQPSLPLPYYPNIENYKLSPPMFSNISNDIPLIPQLTPPALSDANNSSSEPVNDSIENVGFLHNFFSNSFLNANANELQPPVYESNPVSNDCKCNECLSLMSNKSIFNLQLCNINNGNTYYNSTSISNNVSNIPIQTNIMNYCVIPDIITAETNNYEIPYVFKNDCVQSNLYTNDFGYNTPTNIFSNYEQPITTLESKFPFISNIKRPKFHSYIKTQKRNFENGCKKEFPEQKKILNFKKSLKEKGNHCCVWCEKQFYSNYEIQRHNRIHNGERPFPCNICHKRFRQKQHMITHISTVHANNRPYICPNCKKRFKEKGTMTKHIQYTHLLTTRPLKCPKCQHSFKRKGNLKSHLKKIHCIYGEKLQTIVERIIVQPVTYNNVIHNLNLIKMKNAK